MLSERERKLMRWSYEAGFTHGRPNFDDQGTCSLRMRKFDDWLNEVAAEGGITVEMVVDTDAGSVILDKCEKCDDGKMVFKIEDYEFYHEGVPLMIAAPYHECNSCGFELLSYKPASEWKALIERQWDSHTCIS